MTYWHEEVIYLEMGGASGRWSEYLWARGRDQKLVALLNKGAGQGYAAWRVLPAPEVWQRVVQAGLVAGQIDF